MNKFIVASITAAILAATSASFANDIDGKGGWTTYPQAVTGTDGAVATPARECGMGEQCVTVVWPDGSQLIATSEGSATCEPYHVSFVKTTKAGVALATWDLPLRKGTGTGGFFDPAGSQKSCGATSHGIYTMSDGIRVGFWQQKDGNLLPQVQVVGAAAPDSDSATNQMNQLLLKNGMTPLPTTVGN